MWKRERRTAKQVVEFSADEKSCYREEEWLGELVKGQICKFSKVVAIVVGEFNHLCDGFHGALIESFGLVLTF